MTVVATAFGPLQGTPFPNRIVKAGDPDAATVRLVQRRLNETGCGPLAENGVFDAATTRAVKLFQARFPDASGAPLKTDGEIGSLTWGAMFGAATVPSATQAPSALTRAVLDFAQTQIGVMEKPLGSNRGPEVDEYLRAAGLNPAAGSFPWCVAFTHFCYQSAAQTLNVPNPHIRTAGVLDHWNKAANKPPIERVTKLRATADPSLVRPGALFIMDFGGGVGHSGIVVSVEAGRLTTIEGNTNDNGSRNGIGVFRRTARKIVDINKGFIDYGAF